MLRHPEERLVPSVIHRLQRGRKMVSGSAAHYREQADKMRDFAKTAPNDSICDQFLKLAAEYDKLAKRAEARQVKA
jgi:hypothetical protein